jgi:methylenetetrahydrofolate--tRNA-(uracil-5-)-methyltransferase
MPIEIMAARGVDTLRFGPLKPVGLTDPKTGRWAYACLQLRKEDADGKMYNMVGFQTNLTWGEQKKVFSIIPALKNAEFLRYGVMHKNIYLRAPAHLNYDQSLKKIPNLFFAGQITGVEGYVESAASGITCAVQILRKIKNLPPVEFPRETVMGALAAYVVTPNPNFQPMNANFGIIASLPERIRDKKERYRKTSERALEVVLAEVEKQRS